MRTAVKLDPDFEISTENMGKRRDALKEKIDSIKEVVHSHLAQWS